MSKLFYKAMIEDVQNVRCTDTEIENLLDIYSSTVKHMAITLARKSCYELSDFASAKIFGVDGFSLTIERRQIMQQEQWWGSFECGDKNLKIMATLEKD